jgi:hypothetical protein
MKTIKEAVIGLTHLLKDDPEFFIQKPKQETTLEEAVNSFKKTDVYINEIKQKQETLEEAAHKALIDYGIKYKGEKLNISEVKKLMVNMAKWQAERSYSEEDLKTAFLDGWELRDGDLPFSKAMKKWFEQFKKK